MGRDGSSTATRSGAALDAPTVQPWLDKHLPNLVSKAQALRDGATWTEVGALLEAAVQAAQELKPVLAGTARAAFVLAVVQYLVREFASPLPSGCAYSRTAPSRSCSSRWPSSGCSRAGKVRTTLTRLA